MDVGITIPTFDRPLMTCEAFAKVYDDPRVREITVVDDGSYDTVVTQLRQQVRPLSKVRLFHHDENVGCYFNKFNAMAACRYPWQVLLDSDNQIATNYLDALEHVGELDPSTLYVPTWAQPAYDYRAYEGVTITRANVAEYFDRPRFQTALNTCNFVVHRSTYLEVFDVKSQPYAVDSMYFVYCWLASGRRVFFVPGLHYRHRVHGGSNYVALATRTVDFAADLDRRMRELR